MAEATTWYRASAYVSYKIAPVSVERSTGTSVWIEGKRQARAGSIEAIFPTWEEAHQWLLNWHQDKVDRARHQLERAKSLHGNVKGMKRSSVPPDA